MKRDQWNIEDIRSLPANEDDRFDRKGVPRDENDLRAIVSKAASAYANSGGGHILLGVQDNGTVVGISRTLKGREATKDWLEKLLTSGLAPALQGFRIHEVELDSDPERSVFVIDVDLSVAGPHQVVRDCIYYYRAGSQSLPAPHWYLELVRNRETKPELAFLSVALVPVLLSRSQFSTTLYGVIRCRVNNNSAIPGRNVALRVTGPTLAADGPGLINDLSDLTNDQQQMFPQPILRPLLLADAGATICAPFGIVIPGCDPLSVDQAWVHRSGVLDMELSVSLASESGRHTTTERTLGTLIRAQDLAQTIRWLHPRRVSGSSDYCGFGIFATAVRIDKWANGGHRIITILENRSPYDYEYFELDLIGESAEGSPLVTARLTSGSAFRRNQVRRIVENYEDEMPSVVNWRLAVPFVKPPPLVSNDVRDWQSVPIS